jgi:adenylate kinase
MLEPAPGLVRVRMSDLLHQSARWSTGRGARIQAHLEQGQGPPDEEVVPVLLDHLAALNESGAYTPGQDVLILEGVPRSEAQAELLEAKLAVELVIHLRTDDTELLRERCLSDEPTGKEPGGIAPPDPSGPEARRRDFERRLQVFERDTEPVLDRFPTERILELDAGQAPLRIHRAILERVIPVVESPSHPAVS